MHLAILFETIVKKYPYNTALAYKEQVITYAELDMQSSVVMAQLQGRKIGIGSRVGLLFNNPINFIITLLAVVKSSAIYVPFDSRDSLENILSLCKLTNIDSFLHDNSTLDLINFYDYSPFLIEQSISCHNYEPPSAAKISLPKGIDPILYIMFTSGTTTGTPKGVLINHSGVSRFIDDNALVRVGPNDVVLQSSSVAFDASTFEIWNALLNGSKLVLVSNDFEYLSLGKTIREHNISVLWLTTKLFEALMTTDGSIFKPLKCLIFGGEACTHKHVALAYRQLKSVQLINGYGPTENTVFTTMHLVNADDLERDFIPIGKAVNQTECHVLNDSLEEVTEGSIGSLYVGGDGLAHSYLGESPVDGKFAFHSGLNKRLYNTGDLVKFSSKHGYEYIGRTDRQVKVRGYRIELDFIESTTCSLVNINHAFAVYNPEILGHGLVLFYTTQNNEPLDTSVIKQHLQEKLQWYSLPSVIQFVDNIPRSSSNKVDVHQLIESYKFKVNQQANTIENENVSSIWRSILHVNEVNPDDDFFDSGGDSLSSLLLIVEVNKAFGLDLKTSYLIENSLFKDFSSNLFIQSGGNDDVVLMKKGTLDTPVFLIPPLGGGGEMYYQLTRHLEIKNDIYGFNELLGLGSDNERNESIIDAALVAYLAKTYTSLITQSVQVNEVILVGHSLGGNIAIEMLDELNKAGIEVAQIHLIDSYKFGNTTRNNSYEIGLTTGFIRKTLSFLWAIAFKLSFEQVAFLRRSFYKPEINPSEVNDTPVFLYRCNTARMKMYHEDSRDWRKTVKQLSIISVNAEHLTVLKKGHVEELGRKVSKAISSDVLEENIQLDNPKSLSPVKLEAYWGTGWFRYRQQVFTYSKSVHKGVSYPVRWLRYNLNALKPRRSHKEIVKKNKGYTCTVADLNYEASKDKFEVLYKKYRLNIDFEGEKAAYDLLFNKNSSKDVFQTKTISLYDNEKLIGIGFFDLAEYSGAQVLNFFDPDYHKQSIGKYLTLETMRYLQSINYKYFYVGFEYVGHSKMDYKLFVGEEGVEYLDKNTNQWKFYGDCKSDASRLIEE